MKYCLCCGKKLDNDLNIWHKSCILKFFNSSEIPSVDFKQEELEEVAGNSISGKKAITGVQQKISLNFLKESNRLTIVGYPLGYILKPSSKTFPYISEAEHLGMLMAKESGINVVENGLIPFNNGYAYITKRIDRNDNEKIHMEDFCQLSNRPTDYKYSSSCEKVLKIIDKYSTIDKLDKIKAFEVMVFSFIIGNSDMHLKNYSLIYDELGNHLSSSYDLLPVQIIFKEDIEDTALTINGKKTNITRNDFLKLGSNAGIDTKTAEKIINRFSNMKEKYIKLIEQSLLPDNLKQDFIVLLTERIGRLIK